MKTMDEKQFKILNEKLDFIYKALIMNLVKGLDFNEQVINLSNMGLKEIEIVETLNSTRDKVHNILRKKN